MIEQIVVDYKTHLYNSPKSIKEKLSYFKEISNNGLENFTEEQIANLKAEFIKFVNVNFAFFADTYPTKLFRVTNNKTLNEGKKVKLQKVDQLIGPPLNKSYYGRCNLPDESVFYAALNFRTAIWETKPEKGDLITVSEWEIKEGQRLDTQMIFHPELTNLSEESKHAFNAWLNKKKEMGSEITEIFEDLMKFFTEEFMKIVHSEKKENYLFSSIFSSRFLQGKRDKNGFKIEAIAYPSVKMQYGLTNLAILNELVFEKLNLKSITLYEIVETNYDETNVLNDDLIKVSPLIIQTKDFDIVNNKINYDANAELNQAIELHEKFLKNNS
jgi:hypothetical protein